MAEQKEAIEKNTPTGDRRKSKTATAESLLLLSSNPKSLMLYGKCYIYSFLSVSENTNNLYKTPKFLWVPRISCY